MLGQFGPAMVADGGWISYVWPMTQPPNASCTTCGAPATDPSQFQLLAGRTLFGPFAISDQTWLCGPCMGERMWTLWRGLAGLICAVAVVVFLIQGQYLGPIVAVVVFAFWWWLSGLQIRVHRSDRDRACQDREG